ncbi:MAG TPA: lipocalin family protein [Bacteroidia bacterium]|jgi:hypothetical protein|nr:lipocalin family protein [Bacteroidia bacterium]
MKTRQSITGLILVYITTMICSCGNPSDNTNKLIVKKWKLESFKVVNPDSASAPKLKPRTLKDTSDNLKALIDSINRAPSIQADTNKSQTKRPSKEITLEFKTDGSFNQVYPEGGTELNKSAGGTWVLSGNGSELIMKGTDNSLPSDTLAIIELTPNKLSIEYTEHTLKGKTKEIDTYIPLQ